MNTNANNLIKNELNNTTIENKEVLSYEEFCEMDYDKLSHRVDMNLIENKLLLIRHEMNLINSNILMNEINRNLNKINANLAIIQ